MNRIIYKSLAAIGLMSLAYYLYNPSKYNKMGKNAKNAAGRTLKSAGDKISREA